ncbi:nitrilase-related carbon-nitrogen hydrolase [Ammoniphilus sp. CFH 90114]|uniref:nitrilase-related carbon-nitrogen hydrolase n=1 Tax=Ammoniphilus sp. CFH 90114 TaxID=2493665 RepID=UPI00100DEEF9|nr:nitrilase-related carbon-nitrogen hydrolase [Ammoniphilus sp. CFH 90114]RXT07264.1 acyltransferase [Ammoniphilus sp. CFH 90114]
MKKTWNIALAQIPVQDGNKEANLKKMEQFIQEAYQQSADLVLFPELIVTGLVSRDQLPLVAEAKDGYTCKAIRSMIHRYPIHVVYSFIEADGRDVYITSCLMNKEGQLQHYYRKTHLFTDENLLFSKGDQLETFELDGVTFGLLTCYDIEFPEPARALTLQGAQVLLVNSANMSPYENQHRIFCQARAMENHLHVVYCNRLGSNDHYEYHGESLVVHPSGKVLLDGGSDREGLGFTTLVLEEDSVHSYHYLKERRPELYR